MLAWLLVFLTLVVAWLAAVYFSRPGTPLRVIVTVALCWASAATVPVLLPLDITSAHRGGTVVPPLIWRLVYWTTLLVGWLGAEALLSELAAGEFSLRLRMRASLRSNLLLFGAAAGLAVGAALYMLVWLRLSLASLHGIAASLVDGCGVLRLALLLGDGLIGLPRAVWGEAEPRARLRQLCYELGVLEAGRREEVDYELWPARVSLRAGRHFYVAPTSPNFRSALGEK